MQSHSQLSQKSPLSSYLTSADLEVDGKGRTALHYNCAGGSSQAHECSSSGISDPSTMA